MAQERAQQLLKQGIEAARAGQESKAREILQNAVRFDSGNETIWMWLVGVAKDDQERVFCLKQILSINPENEMAIQALQKLGIDPTGEKLKPAAVPLINPEKMNQVQNDIEQLLKSYNPRPSTVLEVEWIKKPNKRLGETAAAMYEFRRRARRMAITGVLGVAVIAVVLFGLFSLIEDDDTQTAADFPTPATLPTELPTATTTFTPLPPIPNATTIPPDPTILAARPTRVPFGVTPQPSPHPIEDGLGGSAGIVSSFLRNIIPTYLEGQYDQVIQDANALMPDTEGACYSEAYYYHILALIGKAEEAETRTERLDFLAQAEEVLATANQHGQTQTIFANNCNNSALLLTTSCVLNFERTVAEGTPFTIDYAALRQMGENTCGVALRGGGAHITLAASTLAQIHLADTSVNPERDAEARLDAVTALNRGLARDPANIDLLMQRAETEFVAENPVLALEFLDKVLLVDPNYQPAQRKRLEALRLLAAQETNPQERETLYQYAADASLDYLQTFPGDPIAYIYQADSLREAGEFTDALYNVERVLNLEETVNNEELLDRILPFDDRLTAREIREDIYASYFAETVERREEGNLDAALSGLERLEMASEDLGEDLLISLHSLRYEIYLEQANYEDALDETESLLELTEGDDEAQRRWLIAKYNLENTMEDYDDASQTLSFLLAIEPEIPEDSTTTALELNLPYILAQAELLARICQYDDESLDCDYEEVVELLTDEEGNAITLQDELQQALADSYLAEARFNLLDLNGEDTDTAAELEGILELVEDALQVRETADDFYLQARVYQALENQAAALYAYEWINYWDQFYAYPFGEEAAEQADAIREALAEAEEEETTS
jgi:hypothetical protein